MSLDKLQVPPESTIPTRESYTKWRQESLEIEQTQAEKQLEDGKKEKEFYTDQPLPPAQTKKRSKKAINPYIFTPKVQTLFCEHLSILGRVTHAARAAGISPLTVRNMEKNNPEFAEMMAEAQMEYRDKIAAEVYRRAVEGWDVPIVGGQFKDQVVAHERKFSDRLLEMEAKRVDPGYREKQTVNVGQQGGVIVISASPANKEDWRDSYNATPIDVTPTKDEQHGAE